MNASGRANPSSICCDWMIFSFLRWESPDNRSHHFARQLAKYGRVLWINPVQHIGKRRSLSVHVGREKDSITVLDLPGGLPFRQHGFLHTLSSVWWVTILRSFLHTWKKTHNRLVCVIQTPDGWDIAKRMPCDLLVYDAHDDWRMIPPNRKSRIEKIECDAAQAAQLTLASSEVLSAYMKSMGAFPLSIPNACEYEDWQVGEGLEEPIELVNSPHPRFLFFGGIDESFDCQSLQHAVHAIPGTSWFFIGTGSHLASAREILASSNVHFLGEKPYTDLVAYAAHSDVLLLPYTITDRNHGRDTVKLYEYLATGKPVVCNPIAQTRRFPEVLFINDKYTPQGFADACRDALIRCGGEWEAVRKAVASEHTWQKRIDNFLSAVAEHLGKPHADFMP